MTRPSAIAGGTPDKQALARQLAEALEPEPGEFPKHWTHHGDLSPAKLHTAYFHRQALEGVTYRGEWHWRPYTKLDGNFAVAVIEAMRASKQMYFRSRQSFIDGVLYYEVAFVDHSGVCDKYWGQAERFEEAVARAAAKALGLEVA